MEGLTVMVLGGTTITESRLWRKSATSDLGSLSACKVIEKNPIELKHLFLVKSFVSYPRIVSPMVDWGGVGGGSSIRYHIRSYQALTFINMIL